MNKQILILSIVAIFLIGCSQTQVETVQPKPQVAPPVVSTLKIGVLMGLTGPAASIAEPVKKTIDLAVEEVNSAGGQQVEVIYEDGKCEPKDTATGIHKLIDQDKVVAIVGALCSSATLGATPIAEEAGVVMVSPASTNPTIKDAGDYIFRVVPSDSLQGKVGAELVNTWGNKKVGILYINNDYGLALANVFKDSFVAFGGEVTATEAYEQGGADFRTELTKVKGSNPEVIYLVGYPQEAGQMLKQMKELGINAKVLASEGVKDPTTLEIAGDAAEGVVVTIPKPNKNSNYESFKRSFDAKYSQEPSIFTAEAYDAFMMIVKAAKDSDGSRSGIKDGLYAIRDYPGASGTMTFDKDGEVEKQISSVTVVKGEFVEG